MKTVAPLFAVFMCVSAIAETAPATRATRDDSFAMPVEEQLRLLAELNAKAAERDKSKDAADLAVRRKAYVTAKQMQADYAQEPSER